MVAQLLHQHRRNFLSTTCFCLGLLQAAAGVKSVAFGLAFNFEVLDF